MTVSLLSLIVEETVDGLFAKAKQIATDLELAVDTWRSGDPTRTLFYLVAKLFESYEAEASHYVKSGFLDFAEGVWLQIKAKQDYDVDVVEATHASCLVTLTNATSLPYSWDPGELILSRGADGPTYRNTATISLGPSATRTDIPVEADEAGSGSNAGAGEINTIVSTTPGVTVANTTAAVGVDEESEASIKARCRAKPASLSPNGPKDAYVFVATTPSLSGAADVTKARSIPDSETGDAILYISNAGGAVSPSDHAAVEVAIANLCAPLCITPSVIDATPVTQAVTYELWIYDSANITEDEVEALVQGALAEAFAARPIGGDIVSGSGALALSLVIGTILGAHDEIYRVDVSSPSANVTLGDGDVILLGSVTGTVHITGAP